MKKGQSNEVWIKNILKFFKMNEDAISTVLGGVVVVVIIGLIFNYFRTTNLKTWKNLLVGEGVQTTKEEQKETISPNGDTYIVKRGDDLWHIAEKYYKSGYNYVDIIKENKLDANGVIEPGMELKLPKVEAKKITVKAAPNKMVEKVTTAEKAVNTKENGQYVTKRGDTYWKIALNAYGDGYAWTKIYEANKAIFPNPNIIHAEVTIIIPSNK